MVIPKSTEDVGMLYRLQERERSQHTFRTGQNFYDEQKIEGSYVSNASSSKEGERVYQASARTKGTAVWITCNR